MSVSRATIAVVNAPDVGGVGGTEVGGTEGVPSRGTAGSGLGKIFSPAARTWFDRAFPGGPTDAQRQAWEAVGAGQDVLVVAPTGSGKTLAAFLWALDRIMTGPERPQDLPRERRCRVLYVSPLKALATDIERNLREPLAGIARTAEDLGAPVERIRVAVRTGDTPQAQRRALTRTPPDILITTPESLYLLLTSQARSVLGGVRTVIIDEVHVLAATKRGAHLALSLERLGALLPTAPQRIGLSATVRPAADVATWLSGTRRPAARLVRPDSPLRLDLRVDVPLADMTSPDSPEPADGTDVTGGTGAGDTPPARSPSIWPHLERRVLDLVTENRSTLVFANSRRTAERFCARLNELHERRSPGPAPERPAPGAAAPAQMMGQAGSSVGAPAVLARSHHGSVSQAERALVERELKEGRLRAVVATSSLELGIDMGAVDLVVQLGAPPSVASGLQRVGRAGHGVGEISRGVILPTFAAQLPVAVTIAERMRAGRIEPLRTVSNPLDVLAQQIVAMVAMDPWNVEDLYETVRGAAPFAGLGPAAFRSVLDLLSGRFPSEDFAHLRARIVWDRTEDLLTARPGAQRLAVTGGGTIPNRGLFGVHLIGPAPRADGATPDTAAPTDRPTDRRGGRRVGELDEEMVHESRVGDVFTLGSTSWRIEAITADRVLVSGAYGRPGRLPFWHGDSPGRPSDLGGAVGALLRALNGEDPQADRERAASAGLGDRAVENLMSLLDRQRAATGVVPDDRTLVLERFVDVHGDWRVVLHSPWGSPVHTPWALVVAARLRERYGERIRVTCGDDGFALRLTDVAPPGGVLPELAEVFAADPDLVESAVTAELTGSALFASRFRESAARALLLPGHHPGRRTPLWQQRLRSARLLQVASSHPDFPITVEALRECLQDVFDVPRLRTILRDLRSRRIRIVELTTAAPSPFAVSLTQGEVAELVYEQDAPLAERRAAALSLDQGLLSELLGREGPDPADLLDPQVVRDCEESWQRLAPDRRAEGPEQLVDLLGDLGPLDDAQVHARCADHERCGQWLEGLHRSGRLLRVPGVGSEAGSGSGVGSGVGSGAGASRWARVEDAGRLRDALGVAVPDGVPEVFTGPVPDPLGDLLLRFARAHGPFPAAWPARWLGVGVGVVEEVLGRLVRDGRLVRGRLRPEGAVGPDSPAQGTEPERDRAERSEGSDHCDPQVLRTLQRRSLAVARSRLAPVPASRLGRFLPAWQQVGGGLRGVEGLADVVEQLAGAEVPLTALETWVLPSRVDGYAPALLDELTATGRVLWSAHGPPGRKDWWVCLHPAELAPVTCPPATGPPEGWGPVHRAVLAVLAGGGGYFFDPLCRAVTALSAAGTSPEGPGRSAEDGVGTEAGGPVPAAGIAQALWDLVRGGLVTNDTLGPLRALAPAGRRPV
ncbi:MAG: ATP-dependent helicase Lhr and Lhr-like helicase, partial [Actinomycetota bacterium]|nr:ATP-dependent helicase Lhr and Lhr-like helicase [Actinomycetota bacterium]